MVRFVIRGLGALLWAAILYGVIRAGIRLCDQLGLFK